MDLILKKIDWEKAYCFVKNHFDNIEYLPDAILKNISHTEGDFYVILPTDTPERFIYQFGIGGQIIPFHKEADQSIVRVINLASNHLNQFLFNYLKFSRGNCIGLEDFNSSPQDEYVRKSPRNYKIIKEHLFYLLDSSINHQELKSYLIYATSWIFFGGLFSIDDQIILDIRRSNLDTFQEKYKMILNQNLQGFFFEIYDGESFLFWVRKDREDIFQLLNQIIP